MSETADQLTQKTLSITILFLAVFGLILFTPAGSFDYWQAWAYWAVFSAAVLFITLYFFLTDPKLIENRLRGGPTAEKERSQKIIQAFSSIFFILLILLPGIDHRFGWSEVPVPLVLTGDIFIALGFFIVFLTFRENRYASSIIIVDAGQSYCIRSLRDRASSDVRRSHPGNPVYPDRAWLGPYPSCCSSFMRRDRLEAS